MKKRTLLDHEAYVVLTLLRASFLFCAFGDVGIVVSVVAISKIGHITN
jgi:hypothetical protein